MCNPSEAAQVAGACVHFGATDLMLCARVAMPSYVVCSGGHPLSTDDRSENILKLSGALVSTHPEGVGAIARAHHGRQSPRQAFSRLAFFAQRNIEPFEELTWDYGGPRFHFTFAEMCQ